LIWSSRRNTRKTCGNDESALLAAGMAGKYFDSLMGSTVLDEIHDQK
jgi:hypothetical protein